MKTSRKKKRSKSSNSTSGGAKNFIIWHGEKIAVGVVVVIALYVAFQGLGYLGQPLNWQPDELVRTATEADTAIRASTRNAGDEGIERMGVNEEGEEIEAIGEWGHALHAQQIRNPISAAPYRHEQSWNPDPNISSRQQRSTSTSTQSSFSSSFSD